MPDQTLSPSQAASQVGVSVHTVRRWCAAHSAYLSESAQPGKGSSRRLTQADVQVLTEIARLRTDEGLTTEAINERLAGVVFGETTAIEPAQVKPVATGGELMPVAILEALQTVETRLQALEDKHEQINVVYLVATAFVAGLLLGLAMWWFR